MTVPWLTLAFLVLAPLYLGVQLGALLSAIRPLRPLRWVLVALCWPASIASAVFGARILVDSSFWDLLGISLRFALGLSVALAWRGKPPWAKLAFATLLTLGLVEGGARLLPVNGTIAPPDAARPLLVPVERRFPECRVLDPELSDAAFARRGLDPEHAAERLANDRAVVVHLGDSLVEGLSAPIDGVQSFVDVLDSAAPAVAHLNAGYHNTGTDFQYLVARRLLRSAWAPDAIVLYLFQNDPTDINRPMACCNAEPFLSYEPALAPRCAAPVWAGQWQRGAEPYVLGLLSHFSRAAGLLRNAFMQLCRGGFGGVPNECGAPMNPDPERALADMTAILVALDRELTDAGVTLAVVVLPLRAELEAAVAEGRTEPAPLEASPANHAALLEVVRRAGLTPLDPWDHLRAAVAAELDALWVDPVDLHLGLGGHRALADWLVGVLPAAGVPALTVPP